MTGNNDADAVYFLRWVESRFRSREGCRMCAAISRPGAAIPAGLGVANIDPQGKVHPDTYWSDYTVGNVKETPFSTFGRATIRCWRRCASARAR